MPLMYNDPSTQRVQSGQNISIMYTSIE